MIGAGAISSLEGIALRASIAEAVAQADASGWKHNARPADVNPNQRMTIFPDQGGVKRLSLKFEDARLIGLDAEYDDPDPDRRQRFEGLPLHREQDGWYYADWGRTVMAYVSPDGTMVRLLHTGSMRDRREVQAMYRTFLGVE